MRGRKQKKSEDTCPQEDRAELESNVEGQTFIRITESDNTNNPQEYRLLEYILSPENMNRAYKQVKTNQGAGGVDKMSTEQLKDYLIDNKEQLIQSVLDGNYRPNPVRRLDIPKGDGSKRHLGIPTVVDRVIRVHPKSITKMKQKVRELTSRSNGKGG
jgi:retron-type reverse transcriptase